MAKRRVTRVHTMAVSLDALTKAAAKRVAERADISISSAVCNMVQFAAKQDPELVEVMREALAANVEAELAKNEWTPTNAKN